MSSSVRSPFHIRYCGSWVALGLLRILSLIPMPLLFHIGTGLGDLLYAALPSRKRVAQRNLTLCFPELSEGDIQSLVKENIRNTARMLLYSGFVWWAPERKLRKRVTVRNEAILDRLENDGCGFILLAPHFLALELGGISLSLRSPGVSVYQRTRNPVFDRSMLRARQRFGGTMYERKDDLRPMLKAIRRGKGCYYLPDQDPGKRRAVFAPFFGVPTATWPVLGRISKLCAAPVLPCATYLLPGGAGFEIVIGEPLEHFPSETQEGDAALMNAAIEHCVKQRPNQYFWVHKRFKTRPPGAPKVYD
ncbi:MAG TPA: lipid A biosynthesis acyltransferase [Gammaproteobacteria bacterium]|nr:lipid A biosynthesis acyltransferase [Gammaproteobacteria bacterium]